MSEGIVQCEELCVAGDELYRAARQAYITGRCVRLAKALAEWDRVRHDGQKRVLDERERKAG